MCFGELVDLDIIDLHDFRKTISQRSIVSKDQPQPHVTFILHVHKADRFFEASTVVLKQRAGPFNSLPIFNDYIVLDGLLRPFPDLGLKGDGRVPPLMIHQLSKSIRPA